MDHLKFAHLKSAHLKARVDLIGSCFFFMPFIFSSLKL